MLGLLAHKWSWRQRRGDDSAKPNVVFGADVHTCWEKFARYFDVEQRVIPLTPDRHIIGPEEVDAPHRREHDRRRRDPRHHLHRPDRRNQGIDELLREDQAGEGLGHPDPRRRRQRRLHRALLLPGGEMGLPARAGALDQRLQPQVRAGLPGDGDGRSSATSKPSPRSWSSRSTTSAARWPTTASTSAAPATRSCSSTTTSSASATRATSGSSAT